MTPEVVEGLYLFRGIEVLSLIKCRFPASCTLDCGRFPSLKELDLSWSVFDGNVLAETLRSSPPTTVLRLCRIERADAVLGLVKEGVEDLSLERTDVTDRGLCALQVTSLTSLDLEWTGITDAALPHIKRLVRLRYVSLSNTQVTPAGIADLRRALPLCQVVGNGEPPLKD